MGTASARSLLLGAQPVGIVEISHIGVMAMHGEHQVSVVVRKWKKKGVVTHNLIR